MTRVKHFILGTSLVALALGGSAATAGATTITFSQPITPFGINPAPAPDPTVNPVIIVYEASALQMNNFITQSYVFGGFTNGVTAGNTTPELNIMLDPSRCNEILSNPADVCAPSAAAPYLAVGEPFAINISSGTPQFFALSSFDGAAVFGPGGCLSCSDDGSVIPTPSFIQVTGFYMGAIVGQQEFALTHDFHTFTLTQPGFGLLGRAVFQGLDANRRPIEGYYGVDNINTTAVPEPASLMLIGSGLAAIAARRRSKASR